MTTTGTISTKINVDCAVDAYIEGDIIRGVDISQLFEENKEGLLGVNFSMAMPPLENEKVTGQEFRDWECRKLYAVLDIAANNTKGMSDFEISYSQIMSGLCHLTSESCHVSVYSSTNGVAVSGLLYLPTFDLHEFLTNIIGVFSANISVPLKVSIEMGPILRP